MHEWTSQPHWQEPKAALGMPTFWLSCTTWPWSCPGTFVSVGTPGSLHLCGATSYLLCLFRFPASLHLQHACAFDLFSVMTFPFSSHLYLPQSVVVTQVKSQRGNCTGSADCAHHIVLAYMSREMPYQL